MPRKKRSKRGSRRKPSSSNPPASAAPRSKPNPRGHLRAALYGLLIALGTAVVSGTATILIWATLDGPGAATPVVVDFTGQESASEVGSELAERGLLSSPQLFSAYFGWFAPGVHVAPGPHLLRGQLSPRRLVQRIGRMPARPRVRLTIPEGYTSFQIAERLEEREICTRTAFLASVMNPALLTELGISGQNAEGYLFPATYDFSIDSDAAQLLRLLAAETRRRLNRVDGRSQGALARLKAERNLGEREVLTLASMVEREAKAAEERPLVARVFLNRLSDPTFRPLGMLQSDPTASYGCLAFPAQAPSCTGFTGRVTPDMLRDAANAYNTYRHAGLPPGPIGNPGEDSILAVLAPAENDFLYFVADGHGKHRFSHSFEEHRRAIEQGSN